MATIQRPSHGNRGIDPHYPAREAPAPSALWRGEPAPGSIPGPSAPEEPLLRVDNIQGNILVGFNKDHQTLLFLRIEDTPDGPDRARAWLAELIPRIATTAQVLAFSRLFKELRDRRGVDPRLQVTWVNIAFSHAGLAKLTTDAGAFTDAAFKAGMAARSASLGDGTGEGAPGNWVIGGPGDEPDIVLIVSGDDPDDLAEEVGELEDRIFAGAHGVNGRSETGLDLMFRQQGATLPSPLTGHEHFGFLDGVSQPGLRGKLSPDPADVLTPRLNPADPGQGKPGQDLLWPGEFVFGYATQDADAPDITVPGPVSAAGPGDWTDDGSYLVVRRLRQDVPGFRGFVADQAAAHGVSEAEIGARIVGRFKSGAPLEVTQVDDEPLGADDLRNNDFEFQEDDPVGLRCPMGAHIRKTYPRDDENPAIPQINEMSTQTHRLLRRGIPYGAPFPHTADDDDDRGLVFAAYQTSIERQFEFVQKVWVNNAGFKQDGVGQDLILGQGPDPRELAMTLSDGTAVTLSTNARWVIPTGGGYYFAPSIEGLEFLAGGG